MPAPFVVRRETHIAAPPATVFAFLTDPDKILSWMGAEAQTEPHPGGLYLVKGVGGEPCQGGARRVPGGGAGPSARLQLRLGGERGRAAGIEPHRDRPDRKRWRHPAAHDPQRASRRRAMREPRQRLGALPRQTGDGRRRRKSRPGQPRYRRIKLEATSRAGWLSSHSNPGRGSHPARAQMSAIASCPRPTSKSAVSDCRNPMFDMMPACGADERRPPGLRLAARPRRPIPCSGSLFPCSAPGTGEKFPCYFRLLRRSYKFAQAFDNSTLYYVRCEDCVPLPCYLRDNREKQESDSRRSGSFRRREKRRRRPVDSTNGKRPARLPGFGFARKLSIGSERSPPRSTRRRPFTAPAAAPPPPA